MLRPIVAALAIFSLPCLSLADIGMPRIFSSGMVLQRGGPVPVYGWGDDGETVTVAALGQKASTVVKDRSWRVNLEPLKLDGPFDVTIAGKNTMVLRDVLLGDVWVSCGQSNMMMGLGSIEGGAELIAQSEKFPQIRTFNVEGEAADAPAKDVRGGAWASASPNNLAGFSAVSYVFGRSLHEHLKTPIGLVNVVSIVPAECWVDRQTLAADPFLVGATKSPLGASRSYNGLIAPLQPFAIKGVIYYQGEYNVGGGRQFRRLFPALIESWRKTWGQADLPFLFVQLAAFGEHKAEKDKKLDMPADALAALHHAGTSSAWAELREAQLMTFANVPKTGMAVAIDVGDAQDIHPKRKIPVGQRLALAARGVAYGEPIVYSGPILDSANVKGSAVELKFRNAGAGLVARGGALEGFELGRNDGTYTFARAEIHGDVIVVSSDAVQSPVAVRYAWADFPRCNLYNAEGLPASPFRAVLPKQAQAADSFAIALKNADFETAGESPASAADWVTKKGVVRSDAKVSAGKFALRLPAGGEASQDGIVAPYGTRYDWNSDPLEPVNFRPGYAFGYSIDIAAGPGAPGAVTAYLRLCGHSTAEAYQYWGGVPEIATAPGDAFVTRHVAGQMTSTFDMGGGGAGVGMLLAFLPSETNKGELLLDNLSPVTILRPRLAIDNATPIDLGKVTPGEIAVSTPRIISNGQKRSLEDYRNDKSKDPTQVVTVLYGVANLKPAVHGDSEHVRGASDDVGAVLIGKDSLKFAFVSEHGGASPAELKLIGKDGKPGLTGGETPETEVLVVKFLGASEPGDYAATVRIITQAANVGTRSTGRVGEPPEAIYYLDVPISVRVNR